MTEEHSCESCSMAIETGTYCAYCVTPTGELQPCMAKMPAWREHPKVAGSPGRSGPS